MSLLNWAQKTRSFLSKQTSFAAEINRPFLIWQDCELFNTEFTAFIMWHRELLTQ